MPGKFNLQSDMTPTGDQPQAINALVAGLRDEIDFQTLLGVTGSGKTFTVAQVIQEVQRPTLVLAHNKTLAGQLCAEFKAFFPDNAVEYFVSYYDYYQPEAYIAATDTFIEKDSAINDEIERLRHSATAALLERRDVIVVSSVSCIYGLGNPISYRDMMVHLRTGQNRDRDSVIEDLVSIQFARNDYDLKRGFFRVRGDSLDIYPASFDQNLIRVQFFGDEIEKILEIDYFTGKVIAPRTYVSIYPASHYATTQKKIDHALVGIEEELEKQIDYFRSKEKLVEAYRIEQRTRYDMEMMKETGFTKGIENYSRFLDGRQAGDPPYTLFDFFPEDFLLVVDESHVTLPQVRGMYGGDRSRKESLVDFGFRLPSALDNRPLNFQEFEKKINQCILVSATPGPYEKTHSKKVVEQIIRPTGLLDPIIEIHPIEGQIEALISHIQTVIERKERALVLTLTKRMAEELSLFLYDAGLRVKYLHSEITTNQRLAILKDLRQGHFDVLVGINLLREGIDLPEVSLVAILDADKEGFLRSTSSLVQMIGRAARNVNGRVVMYADKITDSIMNAVQETNRRREIQTAYNLEHGITPQTIQKEIRSDLDTLDQYAPEMKEALLNKTKGSSGKKTGDVKGRPKLSGVKNDGSERVETWTEDLSRLNENQLLLLSKRIEKDMKSAAKEMNFEEAAILRDKWMEVKASLNRIRTLD